MKISRRAGNRSAMSNKTLFLSPHRTSPLHSFHPLIHLICLRARERPFDWPTCPICSHITRPVSYGLLYPRYSYERAWWTDERTVVVVVHASLSCWHAAIIRRLHRADMSDMFLFLHLWLTAGMGLTFNWNGMMGRGGLKCKLVCRPI